MLQRVAACCSVLQCVAIYKNPFFRIRINLNDISQPAELWLECMLSSEYITIYKNTFFRIRINLCCIMLQRVAESWRHADSHMNKNTFFRIRTNLCDISQPAELHRSRPPDSDCWGAESDVVALYVHSAPQQPSQTCDILQYGRQDERQDERQHSVWEATCEATLQSHMWGTSERHVTHMLHIEMPPDSPWFRIWITSPWFRCPSAAKRVWLLWGAEVSFTSV